MLKLRTLIVGGHSLETAERWAREGAIRWATLDAYMKLWRNSVGRFSNLGDRFLGALTREQCEAIVAAFNSKGGDR